MEFVNPDLTVNTVLLDAVTEVAQTILSNPHFFPARDLLEVKQWVRRLFPDIKEEVFEKTFVAVVKNSELPWQKKRFFVVNSSRVYAS